MSTVRVLGAGGTIYGLPNSKRLKLVLCFSCFMDPVCIVIASSTRSLSAEGTKTCQPHSLIACLYPACCICCFCMHACRACTHKHRALRARTHAHTHGTNGLGETAAHEPTITCSSGAHSQGAHGCTSPPAALVANGSRWDTKHLRTAPAYTVCDVTKRAHARACMYARTQAAYNSGHQDWKKLFAKIDEDHSGELDYEEFDYAIRDQMKVSADQVRTTRARNTPCLWYTSTHMFMHMPAHSDTFMSVRVSALKPLRHRSMAHVYRHVFGGPT